MATEQDILSIADAYAAATGASDITISSRVFEDSKKLTAIREGRDITLRRFNAALEWFSENWPENAEWPRGINRPFGVENNGAAA